VKVVSAALPTGFPQQLAETILGGLQDAAIRLAAQG
jgi:serine/threonine-protein kinase HipA